MQFDLRGRRVLVTGGAGFLGSHLCDRLLAEGAEVVGLDNFYTGRKDNIAHLLGDRRFTLIEHDVAEPLRWEHGPLDAIFNFACPASPVHYQRDPIATLKFSVLGAINMLELAVRMKARIMQASTSEVYGDPEIHPQPEHYWGHVNPVGPRACYDEGKRCAETLFFDYWRRYGDALDIKIMRIFNTYGPRMDPEDGRVISNFIVQALRNEPITIYGDGLQTRSFCYVDDLIEGCIRMMCAPADIRGPMNIGSAGEFNMLELAELVLRLSGSRSELVFQDLPEDDPKQRKADIAMAREILNWEPHVSLEQGLRRTIPYFHNQLAAA